MAMNRTKIEELGNNPPLQSPNVQNRTMIAPMTHSRVNLANTNVNSRDLNIIQQNLSDPMMSNMGNLAMSNPTSPMTMQRTPANRNVSN